jgi:radical SAM protein with 4Fe4S-binding SPASM domain
MDCIQTDPISDDQYLEWFFAKTRAQRVPLSGGIELTWRCNLNCVHCYLGAQSVIRKDRHKELTTDQWIGIIDQVTKAGCLHLLITGGDPLLRKDFKAIYTHAKKNGLLVEVFTNGTLITEDVLSLFQELPPLMVEITLYGATGATYEKITGVKGSYKKCIQGIEGLLKNETALTLKTMLISHNCHEFYDIENMAKAYGVRFRFDSTICGCLSGDKTPIKFRVNPEEVVEKEFSNPKRGEEWLKLYERPSSNSDALYVCGSGVGVFHVNPYGFLQPCGWVQHLMYDMVNGSFEEGWHKVIPAIRELKLSPDSRCSGCAKKKLCGFCPPLFKIENGREDEPSEYVCSLAEQRWLYIQKQGRMTIPC